MANFLSKAVVKILLALRGDDLGDPARILALPASFDPSPVGAIDYSLDACSQTSELSVWIAHPMDHSCCLFPDSWSVAYFVFAEEMDEYSEIQDLQLLLATIKS